MRDILFVVTSGYHLQRLRLSDIPCTYPCNSTSNLSDFLVDNKFTEFLACLPDTCLGTSAAVMKSFDLASLNLSRLQFQSLANCSGLSLVDSMADVLADLSK